MNKLLLLLCAATSVAVAQDFHLHAGDRVVFYGDSITDQRLYTTFTETFVVTRFPKMDVRFTHSGWGGDRVSGGGGGPVTQRVRRDVAAYKPTVVTVMLGMNDGRYRVFDQEAYDTYTRGYQDLVSEVLSLAPDVRMTLIRPSPYDEVAQQPGVRGYNDVLVRYGDWITEFAGPRNMVVADLNAGVVGMLRKAVSADATTAARIIPDRVHPGPAGHLIMAGELLRAWNAPSVISSVTIDSSAARVSEQRGTKVSGLTKDDAGLRWTQLDDSLPMPISLEDPVIKLAVESSDFVQRLNQQILKVSGLGSGSYDLKIDGQAVGTFSQSELVNGVNLATLATPMTKQAAEVHRLTLRRCDIHNVRWRTVDVPLANDYFTTAQAAKEALDALDEEIRGRQRASAHPVPRRYELARKE